MIPWEVMQEILKIPDGRYAVEDFDKMSQNIPHFDVIYKGRSPQIFEVQKECCRYIFVGGEWHLRDHYKIVEIKRG